MTEQPKPPAARPGRAAARGELRVYLTVQDLQPQFAAYMGTPTRARGYPPLAGQHALIMEVAPGLMIERVIDIALKADPDLEPGILFVERQFGILELHGDDEAARFLMSATSFSRASVLPEVSHCARVSCTQMSSRMYPTSTL